MYVNALANGIAAGGKPADMFLLTVTMSKLHAGDPYKEKTL
jgi:hypothetical protein